jgi:hypothetical protein
MGIVPPARRVSAAKPILNGSSGGGAPAEGGIVTPHRGSHGAAPLVNGKGNPSAIPGYGSVDGGPYNLTRQPQSTRSSASPLR